MPNYQIRPAYTPENKMSIDEMRRTLEGKARRDMDRKKALKGLKTIIYRAEKYGWTPMDIKYAVEDYLKFAGQEKLK
jgi:hypothetical protein